MGVIIMKLIKKIAFMLLSISFLQSAQATTIIVKNQPTQGPETEQNKQSKGIINSLYNAGATIVTAAVDNIIIRPVSIATGLTTGIATGMLTSCLTNDMIIKVLQSQPVKDLTNQAKEGVKGGIKWVAGKSGSSKAQNAAKFLTKSETISSQCNKNITPQTFAGNIIRPLIIHHARPYLLDSTIFFLLKKLYLPINESVHKWTATTTDTLISSGMIESFYETGKNIYNDYNLMAS